MFAEYVILVHGTYANEDEDEGERWWQRGSDFWNTLKKKLPNHISLLETESLFHWSGENDVLERHIAGEQLYIYLSDLDRKGLSYHVVAHSHGGSVLWSALRIAELDSARKGVSSLTGLRSSIAIGTPFVLYDQPKLTPITLWSQEVVAALLQFGLPVGVMFLLWPNLGFLSLFALTLFLFTIPFVELRTFPIKFASMQQDDSRIAKKYSNHWLSVWSPDDEAINALRSAIRLRDTPNSLKPSQPIVPTYASNWIFKILFLGHTFAIYLFDQIVVPRLARLVRHRIAASTLGVRFTSRVRKVEPWPCDELNNQQAIPEELQHRLKIEADRHLSAIAPTVREALRSLGSGEVANPLLFLKDNAQRALVHTSYFNHEQIVSTVVRHISAWSTKSTNI